MMHRFVLFLIVALLPPFPAPGVDPGTPRPGIPEHVTLGQAVAIGVSASPLLAQARADARLAAVNVKLVRAPILPDLDATAKTEHVFAAHSSVGSLSGTSNSAKLNLSQLIFDGGHVAAQIQAASESQVAAVDQYRYELQTVASNVANAYYNVLAAHRAVEVDADLLMQNQVSENLVRAQIRNGVQAGAALASAEFPTAQARHNLVVAQGQELTALAAFAEQMGLDANTRVAPVENGTFDRSILSATELPSYDRALARAHALRPDYDAAEATLESSQRTLAAAKRAYFPTLSGTASYGKTSVAAAFGANNGNYTNDGDIGLSVSIPIFDQGTRKANIEQAQATIDYNQAGLANSRLAIAASVKAALVGVVSARAGVQEAGYEVATASTSLASTRGQYAAGVTTLPLLLQASTDLAQALADQTTSIYQLREAEVALLYAMGDPKLLQL